MPDYRRNRFTGGTFFLTVNLLGRRSNLLVRQIEALRTRFGRCASAHLPASTPGSSFPTTCTACGPCRKAMPTSRVVGARSGPRLQIFAHQRTAITRHDQPRRTRHLAAPVLGAPDPRRSGLCGSPRLHAFQPCEARSGGAPGGLAAFVLWSVRCQRAASCRVDGRQRRAIRAGRAAVTLNWHGNGRHTTRDQPAMASAWRRKRRFGALRGRVPRRSCASDRATSR